MKGELIKGMGGAVVWRRGGGRGVLLIGLGVKVCNGVHGRVFCDEDVGLFPINGNIECLIDEFAVSSAD